MDSVTGGRAKTMTNAEAFLYDFGIYATELWSMTETQFLEWLNAECDRERPKHWPAPQCMACRHFHSYLDEERKDSDV